MAHIPPVRNITIFRGLDYLDEYWFKDQNGNPVDLTGQNINCEIREEPAFDSQLIDEFSVTWLDQENGHFTLSLSKTETEAITQNTGFYTLVLTGTDSKSFPWVTGQVEFKKSATEV